MGSTMGNIGSAIGSGAKKLGGGIKNTFSKGGMEVEGTGVNVDTLRDGGYTDKEIAGFGALKPSTSQKVTRAALLGIGGGMSNQPQPQPAQGGAPVDFNIQQPQLDPALFEPSDYLNAQRRRFGNPLFGG